MWPQFIKLSNNLVLLRCNLKDEIFIGYISIVYKPINIQIATYIRFLCMQNSYGGPCDKIRGLICVNLGVLDIFDILFVGWYSVVEMVCVWSVFSPTYGGMLPTFSTASGGVRTVVFPRTHWGKKAAVTNHLQWPDGGKFLHFWTLK